MRCAACGFDNTAGQKFCGQCGTPLNAGCPSCGTANPPGHRFCGECGAALAGTAAPVAARPAPVGHTERRVCSVLFCDLVGFTPLSEIRDPEDVRELLSRYFEVARTVITRYGGVVEKFIGDAVMAVWGTPTAAEGDAERAVRAALDVVAAVAQLGTEVGAPGLAVRAGVVTGEVAVNLSAVGEGMVAGDAVNTAARVQAAGTAGQVLVDEATFRLARSAVAFGPGHEHVLKGKAEKVALWLAERVVSGVGGGQRVDGLESPLVGRDAEMRLIKELFHASVDRRTPRLVSVTGAAGVGKSRLGWEFEKYVDGLAMPVNWHRGRCLSYGSGIAFWALAEMVRQRFGIAEEDPADVVATRLAERLPEFVADAAIREFVAPRLARLLGIIDSGDAAALSQSDLFAGWRLFLEHLAADAPVVLLVEDLHHADDGLLDFLVHLMDWARASPIFVLTFGRPELAEAHPQWGSGRGGTTLVLETLDDAAMTAMLDGLVPDLPARAAAAIAAQAQGVPLYAVETVRMLVDRDVIRPIEGVYRLVADVGELRVPDSLQSLLAARLDSLDADARAVVADAAVLGSTFPLEALVTLSGRPEPAVRQVLDDLVRREVFQVRADPLSPDRGQFGFVQALLRQVAYDTLPRRERKARHLAVAEHLASSFGGGGDEVSEIVAGHLLDALDAVPGDTDAAQLRERAVIVLERAGERAQRTGAPVSAARAFLRAANVLAAGDSAADELTSAGLREKAAGQLRLVGMSHEAAAEYRRAEASYAAHGLARRAAVAAVSAIEAREVRRFAPEDVPAMLAELGLAMTTVGSEVDADTVNVVLAFAKVQTFLGHAGEAEGLYRQALVLAQELELDDRVMADLLATYGVTMIFLTRRVEGTALLREALRRAESAGDQVQFARVALNLSELLATTETVEARELARLAVTNARRLGAGGILGIAYANLANSLMLLGEWDEMDAVFDTAAADGIDEPYLWLNALALAAARGDGDRADAMFAVAEPVLAASSDVQDTAAIGAARAVLALVHGRSAEGITLGEQTLHTYDELGPSAESTRWAWTAAIECALAAPDLAAVDRLLGWLDGRPRGHVPPVLRAERARAIAVRAALVGESDPELDAAAVEAARAGRLPYQLARALLVQAEHLVGAGESAAADLAMVEAGELADRLDARSVLARLSTLAGTRSTPIRAAG